MTDDKIMNPKTKKIIAREGIFFFLFIFGIICLVIGKYYGNLGLTLSDTIHAGLSTPGAINDRHDAWMKSIMFHKIGFWSLVSYGCYVATRFIIWAIKTLRRN